MIIPATQLNETLVYAVWRESYLYFADDVSANFLLMVQGVALSMAI